MSFPFVALRCEKGKVPSLLGVFVCSEDATYACLSDSSSEELAWASMGDGLIGVPVSGEDSPYFCCVLKDAVGK